MMIFLSLSKEKTVWFEIIQPYEQMNSILFSLYPALRVKAIGRNRLSAFSHEVTCKDADEVKKAAHAIMVHECQHIRIGDFLIDSFKLFYCLMYIVRQSV